MNCYILTTDKDLKNWLFKGTVCQILSFMLIGTLDGVLVQNLCLAPHFNPKSWALEIGQRVPLLSRPKNVFQQNSIFYKISKHFKKFMHFKLCNAAWKAIQNNQLGYTSFINAFLIVKQFVLDNPLN